MDEEAGSSTDGADGREIYPGAEGDQGGAGGIFVDGLYVPEHALYARRGGIRWGEHKPPVREDPEFWYFNIHIPETGVHPLYDSEEHAQIRAERCEYLIIFRATVDEINRLEKEAQRG